MTKPSRGDVVVLAGALLLAISSFLPFYDSGYASSNAWTWYLLPLLVVGFGSGVLAGVLIALDRFTTVGNVAGKVGLTLHQLVGVLVVVSAVDLTLYVLSAPLHGVGQWLALLAAALLLLGSVLARHVPALTQPVGVSVPTAPATAPVTPGAAPVTPGAAPVTAAAAPAAGGAAPAAGGAAPAAAFWFSVGAPTVVHDRADGAPRGTLQPGRWYLATASYDTAVEVSAEEFGTAILHDLTVVQRA